MLSNTFEALLEQSANVTHLAYPENHCGSPWMNDALERELGKAAVTVRNFFVGAVVEPVVLTKQVTAFEKKINPSFMQFTFTGALEAAFGCYNAGKKRVEKKMMRAKTSLLII